MRSSPTLQSLQTIGEHPVTADKKKRKCLQKKPVHRKKQVSPQWSNQGHFQRWSGVKLKCSSTNSGSFLKCLSILHQHWRPQLILKYAFSTGFLQGLQRVRVSDKSTVLHALTDKLYFLPVSSLSDMTEA